MGIGDTSLGKEDARSSGLQAAGELRRAEALAAEILAVEVIAARRAWFLRGGPPAAGLAGPARELEGAVPPVVEDRPRGPDVDAVLSLLPRLPG